MGNPSLVVLVSSALVTLTVFLVGESSSFHLSQGKHSSRCFRHLHAVDQPKPFGNLHDDRCFCLGANMPSEEFLSVSSNSSEPRRVFLADVVSKGAAIVGIVSSASLPQRATAAAGTDLVSTGTIKVTPIAHTFVTTGKLLSPKPVRENDATRFFTNAKVVYLFEGSNNGDNLLLAQEVTDLTKKRKVENGPGVTPGNLRTLIPEQLMKAKEDRSAIVTRVVESAKQMPDGDVLMVGPIPSLGTADDGRLLTSTASSLGTFVGGKKEQGVISVLLNGPTENLKLNESGFPVSELLWYSIPPRK